MIFLFLFNLPYEKARVSQARLEGQSQLRLKACMAFYSAEL